MFLIRSKKSKWKYNNEDFTSWDLEKSWTFEKRRKHGDFLGYINYIVPKWQKLQKLQKNNLIRMKKLGKEWEEIRKKIDKLELDITKGEIAAKVENNENFFVKVKDYFLENWLIIIMATWILTNSKK